VCVGERDVRASRPCLITWQSFRGFCWQIEEALSGASCVQSHHNPCFSINDFGIDASQSVMRSQTLQETHKARSETNARLGKKWWTGGQHHQFLRCLGSAYRQHVRSCAGFSRREPRGEAIRQPTQVVHLALHRHDKNRHRFSPLTPRVVTIAIAAVHYPAYHSEGERACEHAYAHAAARNKALFAGRGVHHRLRPLESSLGVTGCRCLQTDQQVCGEAGQSIVETLLSSTHSELTSGNRWRVSSLCWSVEATKRSRRLCFGEGCLAMLQGNFTKAICRPHGRNEPHIPEWPRRSGSHPCFGAEDEIGKFGLHVLVSPRHRHMAQCGIPWC
jgi:hypothetical protein